MRFPKLRYRLATLLVVMTVIAVVSWAIPEWRVYQRRLEFERAAAQFKAGPEVDIYTLPPNAEDGNYRLMQMFDAAGNQVTIYPFRHERYWYTLYFVKEPVDPEEMAAADGAAAAVAAVAEDVAAAADTRSDGPKFAFIDCRPRHGVTKRGQSRRRNQSNEA